MFDSGITTLNLAVTGKPDEFASPGTTVSYIGESDSGKTVLGLTTLAASFYASGGRITPLFYAFEPNLLIDIERLFGKKFAKALETVTDLGMTLEQWQVDVRDRFKAARKPMLAVLDSTDALQCKDDIEAGNKVDKGSTKAGYGTAKAAAFSRALPEITKAVSDNQGLLILLSQVRENPAQMFGSPLRRSGGKALNYYSELMVWLATSNKEKVEDVKVGGWTKIEVKRNKVTGETRTIYAPIYPAYGIDDIRAMLHFLADTDSGASWTARDMSKIKIGEQEASLAEMAAFFDTDEDTRSALKKLVVEAWNAREAKISNKVLAGRPRRFS